MSSNNGQDVALIPVTVADRQITLDEEWARLSSVIPSDKISAVRDFFTYERWNRNCHDFLKLSLTSEQKAAIAKTRIFEEYALGRMMDFFIGTHTASKTQLTSFKLLMEWRHAQLYWSERRGDVESRRVVSEIRSVRARNA